MRPDPYVSLLRRGGLAVVVMSTVIVSAVALAGCTAAPEPTPTSTGDPTPEITTLGEAPEASETPSPEPVADISIPASCEDIYSAEMLSLLQAGNPPLNDPGVTMDSTEVPEALDIVRIRCADAPLLVGSALLLRARDERHHRRRRTRPMPYCDALRCRRFRVWRPRRRNRVQDSEERGREFVRREPLSPRRTDGSPRAGSTSGRRVTRRMSSQRSGSDDRRG